MPSYRHRDLFGLRLPLAAAGAAAAALLGTPGAAPGAPVEDSFENATISVADAEADAGDGWRASNAALDSAVRASGERSLRLDGTDAGARALRRVPAEGFRGNRVRLRALVRTEGAAAGAVALLLRVDGPSGLLYFDRVRGPSGTTGWTAYTAEAPLFPETAAITFGALLDGAGTVWIDDVVLEDRDTRELPEPSPAARRYLERALAIMREHALVRASVDWPRLSALANEQLRGAQTAADAHLAVSYALRLLGDDHSYLSTAAQARALAAAPVSNARTGRRPLEPRTELLPGRVGYLWLPGFAGGRPEHQVAFGDRVQAAIAELEAAGSCGFVVDLRDNRGGNLWPMLIGVGPLLGEGVLGASHFPDGRRTELSYVSGQARYGEWTQLRVSGEPLRLRAPEPPIAVLIGRGTASSAEVLAAGFRGKPNVRSFGTATQGVSTGTRNFELSDGAELVLAVAATSDRTGTIWNGPLVPDVIVAAERGIESERPLPAQPVVRAALDWLAAQPACASAAGQELDAF